MYIDKWFYASNQINANDCNWLVTNFNPTSSFYCDPIKIIPSYDLTCTIGTPGCLESTYPHFEWNAH